MVSCYSQLLGTIRLVKQEGSFHRESRVIQNKSDEPSSPADQICPLSARGTLVVLTPVVGQVMRFEPTPFGVTVGREIRYFRGGSR